MLEQQQNSLLNGHFLTWQMINGFSSQLLDTITWFDGVQ